jgi:hypothetical protein
MLPISNDVFDAVKMFPPAKQHVLTAGMVFPVSPATQYVVKISCPLATFRRYYDTRLLFLDISVQLTSMLSLLALLAS